MVMHVEASMEASRELERQAAGQRADGKVDAPGPWELKHKQVAMVVQ